MFRFIQISPEKYDVFCYYLQNEANEIISLTIFKSASFCDFIYNLCGKLFCDEINQIIFTLSNPHISISAFDIPSSNHFNQELNTIFGIGLFIGIFNNIANSSIDPLNETPFTLHAASHSNGEKLDSLGLSVYTPKVKLGFHNDGLLSPGKVEIPKHIALYNLYISYHNPGNFMWVPTALWEEAQQYHPRSIGENVIVKTKLTPIFHSKNDQEITAPCFNYVTAPLSIINEEGEQRFFLNGQILPGENHIDHVNLVNAMRLSLQNNPKKIYIPQKERRGIILKNHLGFHARDIFQDPIDGVDLSRILLRSVDLDAELYPSLQIE